MTIRKTQLWKSLSPCVRRKDWPVLAREMQRAIDGEAEDFWDRGDATQLLRAFNWAGSPQGRDFWAELHDRLYEAGYEDVARVSVKRRRLE